MPVSHMSDMILRGSVKRAKSVNGVVPLSTEEVVHCQRQVQPLSRNESMPRQCRGSKGGTPSHVQVLCMRASNDFDEGRKLGSSNIQEVKCILAAPVISACA